MTGHAWGIRARRPLCTTARMCVCVARQWCTKCRVLSRFGRHWVWRGMPLSQGAGLGMEAHACPIPAHPVRCIYPTPVPCMHAARMHGGCTEDATHTMSHMGGTSTWPIWCVSSVPAPPPPPPPPRGFHAAPSCPATACTRTRARTHTHAHTPPPPLAPQVRALCLGGGRHVRPGRDGARARQRDRDVCREADGFGDVGQRRGPLPRG